MKTFWLGLIISFCLVSQVYGAQHDYVIENQPGAAFRSDLNSVLQAITTNNSGAAEPATKYANMWWYDTSTGLLKRRNNANDAWVTLGLEAADTDGTLAANSDSKIPTQKAVKTYADTKVTAPSSTTENKIPQWDSTSKKLKDGLTIGTSANNLVQLDASSKLPPVDGSQLTNLPTSGFWTHSGTQVFSGTSPTSWTDLNLSSVVGSARSLVLLKVLLSSATVSNIAFRTKGETADVGYGSNASFGAGCTAMTIENTRIGYAILETDASGYVQWKDSNNASITITLIGYIK